MRYARGARRLFDLVQGELRNRPFVPAGHYYSPRTSSEDIARAKAGRRPPVGIDLNEGAQLDLARRLQFTVPPLRRWTPDQNDMYGPADASVLRSLLLDRKPKRVVEIGSGFSTAVMLDVAEQELTELTVTCVEPYADRLRSRLRPGDSDRLTLVERPVQTISPEDLAAMVEPGDIFFIDSTHVVKAGSDVAHLFLHTLPLLAPGVLVHVHDVFWPFEYPDGWLDHRRDWTELYLLHAFLLHNQAWRTTLFTSWLWQEHPELAAPTTANQRPGAFWFERVS